MFDGIISDVVVVEAEEDEVGNLVDTVISVVVVESEVKSEVGVDVSINVKELDAVIVMIKDGKFDTKVVSLLAV